MVPRPTTTNITAAPISKDKKSSGIKATALDVSFIVDGTIPPMTVT